MTAVRLARNAFVRCAPDANAAPLGLARRGECLPTTGAVNGGWLAVEWNGLAGWVWGSFLGGITPPSKPSPGGEGGFW